MSTIFGEPHFFGKESEKFIDSKNDYIRKIKNAGVGALFLQVREAKKRRVKKELMKVLGDQDKSPKTGPYTACCTNLEMGKLIVEMLDNDEHLEDLSKNEIEKAIANLPIDDSCFKFHEYRSHDYRRLHITLSSLDLELDDKVEICCSIHGQRSRDIFFTYFQWGLMQRRNSEQKEAEGLGLQLFNINNG